MNQILAIAKVTYREALRNRVMYSLLFFMVALLMVAAVVDKFTVAMEGRVVFNLGLLGVEVFGALIAVYLGVSAMAREIARRTVYVVLAKPVSRLGFLLGKYVGLLLTLALLVGVMGSLVSIATIMFGGTVGTATVVALMMIWVELALLSAVALLFSVVSGPFLSGMFTLGVFVIGHLSKGLAQMGANSEDGMVHAITQAIYYVVPNLELFSFKTQALYHLPVGFGALTLALLYAVAYTGALLAAAGWLFGRRDFA